MHTRNNKKLKESLLSSEVKPLQNPQEIYVQLSKLIIKVLDDKFKTHIDAMDRSTLNNYRINMALNTIVLAEPDIYELMPVAHQEKMKARKAAELLGITYII